MDKLKKIIKFLKKQPVILVCLLTLLSHAFNLFGYPAIEGDEGVYVGQAWWLVNFGEITPYTYWYDHFPLGWLQIGLWQKLTGGPFTFGMAAFSGRVFITLLTCLTNVFLYLIVEKITKKPKLAFLASLLFALSPLAIFYHRKILLDNISIFWLILAVYSLITAKGRLSKFFLSGLFWGIAFLSKESAIFFAPAFLFGLLSFAKKENRAFSMIIFLLTTGALVSLLPVLSILKGEFLPASWSNGSDHVSFIETIFYQMGRGNDLHFWQAGSDFQIGLKKWLELDPILFCLGLWSFTINLVFGKKKNRFIALLAICYLFFLIRGGLILDFYLIPLIPFLVIGLALALGILIAKLSKLNKAFQTSFAFIVLTISLIYLNSSGDLYRLDVNQNQKAMVEYIKRELNPEAVIVTDFNPWVDLKLPRFKNDLGFKNTEWFYKVELDPAIRNEKFKNRYYSADYLIITKDFLIQIETHQYSFLKEMLDNSTLVTEYRLHPEDGYWVALHKINKQKPNSFARLINHH